jgi:hypothetical protein
MAVTTEQIKDAAAAAKAAESTPLTDADDRGNDFVPTDDDAPIVEAPKKKAPKKKAEVVADPDPEPEEEEEEELDEEEEDDDPDLDAGANADPDPVPAKKPGDMIPRARFNQMREKAKAKQLAAETRAAELEAQLLAQQQQNNQSEAFKKFTNKVNELYEDVEKARAEGDATKAAKLQRELDELRDNANRSRAEWFATQTALKAQQEAAYNAVVDQVELLAPELNPNSDEFDEDMLAEIDSLTKAFEAQGQDSVRALKRALKATLGKDIFAKQADLRDKKVEPKKTDIAKNVAAIKKEPPDVKVAPEKEQKLDASKLTDEEYAKLPASTRARLRGDYV